MTCPRCRRDNAPDAVFCDECGARLETPCAGCGTVNRAAARFCRNCGRQLGPAAVDDRSSDATFAAPATYTPRHLAEKIWTSRAALEGERKHVTVLFADLKGSLELLVDRDPEEARKILDPVLELMMEAVHHYEGTVNQVMGDGIMALFGAPVAHEDHAVRACYAALRIHDRVKRYADDARRTHGVAVRVRIGLNSGEVVVRAIGSDLRMDYSAVGEVTHIASRMEQLADPGATLLTSSVLRLAEAHIDVDTLGPVPVKGLPAPVEVHALVGARAVASRLHAAAARGLTRFVGRDRELAELRGVLAAAHGGSGQVVAVVGEPGIGKSRLYWECLHSPDARGWTMLQTACVSYGSAAPYLPIIDMLRSYFRIDTGDDARTITEKVTGKLLALDRELESSITPVLSLLDAPIDDQTWSDLDARDRRERTLEGVKRVLVRESRVKPLAVLIEDLHWIDAETQELLDRLVDSLAAERLLLLVNYRPEYEHGWRDKPYHRELRIDPLSNDSAESLLEELLGRDPSVDELKRRLIARTDANPFFLEESVRQLVDARILAGTRGAYRLARPVEALEIPGTVRAVLAARIDRLSPEDKRLLQTASVVGTTVPLALLESLAGEDHEDLRSGLARLLAAEFLYERRLFPDLEYAFTHNLTHDVAYETVLHERRRELHVRVLDAMERLYESRPAEHLERLADHAVRGEVWNKAVRYLRRVAVRATARSAYRKAVSAFEGALSAIAHLPPGREATELAIDTRLDARVVLVPLAQYGRILAYMREAEPLARELGDQRRLGLVLADMGARLRNVGEHQQALAASRQAVEIATALGDRALEIEATYRLGQAHFAVGDLADAIALFRHIADALADGEAAHAIGLPRFFAAWPHNWLALGLAHLGRFAEALAHAEEAIRMAERAGLPHTIVEAHGVLGGVRLERGDLDGARRAFERGVSLVRAGALRDATLSSGLGYVYALCGRLSDAVPLLEEAVAGEDISSMGVGVAVRISRLAEAYLLADNRDAALERARQAVEIARTRGERANEAIALRVLADVTAAGDASETERAGQQYTDSLALAETIGMRPLAARCHVGLAALCERAGRIARAREHARHASTLRREMGLESAIDGAAGGQRAAPS